MCSENRTDDDWTVDDNIMSHPKKRRHEEKDAAKKTGKQIRGKCFSIVFIIIKWNFKN